ncbi:MAG: hypothetical protein EOP13_07545 [Pseudomonas sp.]|uniref:hypothetical protein n=1 Tax=Pseudomonas sp. TaxID=306 RepID=UPI00121000AA|nr:hypothetical protein [Pseudomonas sp.]RZI74789.1 MAG: hypothetical protein EOP13_07545 [Pseudomonas sp.]
MTSTATPFLSGANLSVPNSADAVTKKESEARQNEADLDSEILEAATVAKKDTHAAQEQFKKHEDQLQGEKR